MAGFKPYLGAMLAALAACQSTPSAREFRAHAPALESCPQSRPALRDLQEGAWEPAASALADHEKLRTRLGADMPVGPTMILVLGTSSHYTTTKWSTAAVRGPDGLWRIDSVGEEGPALLRMETTRTLPVKSRTVSRAESRKLDLLLGDRCLYVEPDVQARAHEYDVSAWYSVMDIVTPSRRRTVAWVGRSEGVTGAIADIILGRGED
jgi:hypothetical protein